jgi:alpha-tubulin suppressor-like RCC1 family protein
MRSSGIKAVVAIVSVLGLASVLPAASARAAAPAPVLYGFGTNQFGELGNGTTSATPSQSPTPAAGLPGTIRQLATGLRSSGALLTDGSLWTWGDDSLGQLGYDSNGGLITTPTRVPGLSGITQVALSGEGSGYAVKSDGSLWAWGNNSGAQLGNGSTTSTSSPVRVPLLTGVTQVVAGGEYALALQSDGTVWSWGINSHGELGDGTTYNESLPEPVSGLTGIAQVASGGAESFAVRADGTLFSWGWNSAGELGNGTTTESHKPAAVPGLSGVTQVASDGWSTLAVAGPQMGVWAWGDNVCGELGDGTTTSKLLPEPIGLTGVTKIAAGTAALLQISSAAIRSDGTLWTWGCDSFGQLGHSGATGGVPRQVTNLAGVTAFAFGDDTRSLFHQGGYSLAVGWIPTTVPNLIGDTVAQAGQALNAAGLLFGSVTYGVDYTCTKIGLVTSQSPGGGTRVSAGSMVSIRVATAPRPPRECPDLRT